MAKFISASLKRKILVSYGLVLGLVVIVCILAVVNLYRLGRASDAILQENYRSILAAENMINALERQDSGLLLSMTGFTAEGEAQFRTNEVEFLQWLARAKDNITLDNEADTLQSLETDYVTYLADSASLFEAAQAGSVPHSTAYYHETILPEFKRVRELCTTLREMNQQAMLSASDEARAVATRTIWSMSGFGLVVAVVGLGLSLLLAGFLTRPLREMTGATEQIAQGNYDVTLNVDSGDELSLLAQKIMTMSRELKAFHELNVNRLLAEKRRGEAIIHSITDGLVVVDHAFAIIAINPVAARVLNIPPEQAEGQHFFDVIDSRELYHHMKHTAETGQPSELAEPAANLTIQRGGQTQYYRFTITPVKTDQDLMLGVVLLLQDVTKLKALDQLKSEFVMTASHELRTPLTSIAMSIGLLVEDAHAKLSENEQALLCAAQEDVQRLQALINNLLDLSKIESGRMGMDIEVVSLPLLTQRAMATLAPQAGEKGIELTEQIPEQLPDVKADPNKITWVLTNLIGNAVRYTPQSGHIKISARLINDHVYVSVADDGAGIPQEYQAKIFDKFVQVKTPKAVGGSGLGLAICKEIVKAHGGTIWVDSTPGAGSTFTFTLPAATTTPAIELKGATNHA